MTLMTLDTFKKKLGLFGMFTIICAVVNMFSELLHYHALRGDVSTHLYSITGKISETMAFVFPNSLYFVFLGILREHASVMCVLAFFVLFDIPLAYACGRGMENLRNKHGLLISIGAYIAGSALLYVVSVFLAFRI